MSLSVSSQVFVSFVALRLEFLFLFLFFFFLLVAWLNGLDLMCFFFILLPPSPPTTSCPPAWTLSVTVAQDIVLMWSSGVCKEFIVFSTLSFTRLPVFIIYSLHLSFTTVWRFWNMSTDDVSFWLLKSIRPECEQTSSLVFVFSSLWIINDWFLPVYFTDVCDYWEYCSEPPSISN